MTKASAIAILLMMVFTAQSVPANNLVWPPPPDEGRIEYVGEIDCGDLSIKTGFFGKLGRLFGGKSASEEVSLPFDLVVSGSKMYLVCQNIPALIEIDRDKNEFVFITDKKHPFQYPISLCHDDAGTIYVTDGEAGVVYRYQNEKLAPLISEGLNRPTGIAALPGKDRLLVIDTGDQAMKIFDLNGNLIRTISDDSTRAQRFNYPTFAAATTNNQILVNDALNFEIKRFDAEGNYLGSFGQEGEGPGTFSRPKGVATDSDSHIYVVDNLFDNVQVFDQTGQILLAIGARGQNRGEFWSPAGIDIENDTVYIADTFNNRIQILHYLKEKP